MQDDSNSVASRPAARPERTWSTYLSGPFTRFGLAVGAIICVLDQASKQWMLQRLDLDGLRRIVLAPVLELVLVRNYGISYGLFQQNTALGRWALVVVTAVAIVLLSVWLARAESRLVALSLGLVIGGAVGNAIDRIAYGWVVDFVRFHITTDSIRFDWWVFNLADAAIVAGVAGLLYESVFGGRAAKPP